ncbi:MAG: hypothetical protein A3I73_00895 [Omnitrophica bacterium RIFCSPLOWO2_02_FULL_45_16]|nr:MAG: hypothetical protein A3C51_04325 [Omnitrophica bacterium RIFCSPHIGHO2_02_FULL_46_20]OGX00762.1 MAG: hypothetical protein A3I73_00895 [Omnitrophica bacterium RIFCSPLOWO2_02_FULL_45_16]
MDYFEDREGIRHDIKERDPKLKKIFREAENEASQELSKRSNIRSNKTIYCRLFWSEKKRILKEKYNIDWTTLAEMNPEVFGVLIEV